MQTFRVFNENNVLVDVTARQLDDAVSSHEMLPTHIANAAAAAKRQDLIPLLRSTLGATQRRNKLAAARALLALDDHATAPLLRQRAATETDPIVANMFRALALRLDGIEAVRRTFEDGDRAPQLAGVLASIYNGVFDLSREDVEFLLDAVADYIANSRAWIATMPRDEWRSDLYVMIKTLSRDQAKVTDRERMKSVLSTVASSRADRDTKKEAQRLLDDLQ